MWEVKITTELSPIRKLTELTYLFSSKAEYMLDVPSTKQNNIPKVVFKIMAFDHLVVRHSRVHCIPSFMTGNFNPKLLRGFEAIVI